MKNLRLKEQITHNWQVAEPGVLFVKPNSRAHTKKLSHMFVTNHPTVTVTFSSIPSCTYLPVGTRLSIPPPSDFPILCFSLTPEIQTCTRFTQLGSSLHLSATQSICHHPTGLCLLSFPNLLSFPFKITSPPESFLIF